MTSLGWRCHTRAAPSCDMFNLGSSYFRVPHTTVRHLLNVAWSVYLCVCVCVRACVRACVCVCLSDGHRREPCKNGWTDQDAIQVVDSGYYYFLTPVLNSHGMKKLRYAIQKSTKITLEWTIFLLLHKTVMQRWHCTAESERRVAEIKSWFLCRRPTDQQDLLQFHPSV